MTSRRRSLIAVLGIALVASLIYLRDPAWMGDVTVGLRDWQESDGVRYRWSTGRASFFVPASAIAMTLPLRAVYPGPDGVPVTVDVFVDDRALTTIRLLDPDVWVDTPLPLEHRPTSRRYRRVDLRVSRMVSASNWGVQVGEVRLELR
jgi:hypothetical protein